MPTHQVFTAEGMLDDEQRQELTQIHVPNPGVPEAGEELRRLAGNVDRLRELSLVRGAA